MGNGRRAALIGCFALSLIAVSCRGDDDGDLTREGVDDATPASAAATVDLPARDAPIDVAGVDLPDDVSEVVAVMSGLPDSIAGLAQDDPVHGEGDVRVGYRDDEAAAGAGPVITFRAINLASPDGFYPPDWTAGQVVERSSVPGDDVLEFGIDGEIAWARMSNSQSGSGSSTASTRQGMIFGETTGHWVFSVQAKDDDLLETALDTFINAAADVAFSAPSDR